MLPLEQEAAELDSRGPFYSATSTCLCHTKAGALTGSWYKPLPVPGPVHSGYFSNKMPVPTWLHAYGSTQACRDGHIAVNVCTARHASARV